MPNTQNVTEVKNLREKIASANSMVFAEYHGLKAAQIDNLRAKMREAGATMQVTKNTLLAIALKEEGYKQDLTTDLKGPVATFFANEDSIAPIKTLYEFVKEFELPEVKAGFVDKVYTSKEVLAELSNIPSTEVLISKLMGSIKSPVVGFVNLMSINQRNFVQVLARIAEAKSE